MLEKSALLSTERDEIFEVEWVRAFLAKNLRKYRRGTVAVQACHVEFAGIGHQVG